MSGSERGYTPGRSKDREPAIDAATLYELPPTCKLVLYVLDREGPLRQQSIVDETRLTERSVRYALERLRDTDVVMRRRAIDDARQYVYTIDADLSVFDPQVAMSDA